MPLPGVSARVSIGIASEVARLRLARFDDSLPAIPTPSVGAADSAAIGLSVKVATIDASGQ